MNEKEKYMGIYSEVDPFGISYAQRHNEYYGGGFWGEGVVDFLKSRNILSLIDIGCGQGRFINSVYKFIPRTAGADIASIESNKVFKNPKTIYLNCEAKNILTEDKTYECLTSFDCLEHCLEEDIDKIIKEFDRVTTKMFIFSISYVDDDHNGVPLHMTVKPEDWWVEKLSILGTPKPYGRVPYLPFEQPYILIER